MGEDPILRVDDLAGMDAPEETSAPTPLPREAAASSEEEGFTEDWLSLPPARPGQVPIFSPLPVPVDFSHHGVPYRVMPNQVVFVPKATADHIVGPDNTGGTMSSAGVRRLYTTESLSEAEARATNARILESAGVSAGKFAKRNTILGSATPVHDPTARHLKINEKNPTNKRGR